MKNLIAIALLFSFTVGCGFSEMMKNAAGDSEKNSNSAVAEKNSSDNSSNSSGTERKDSSNDAPFGSTDAGEAKNKTADKPEKADDSKVPKDDPPTTATGEKTGIPECDEAIEIMFEDAEKEISKSGDSPYAKQITDGLKQMIYESIKEEIKKNGSDKAKAAEGCRKVREEYEKQKAAKN